MDHARNTFNSLGTATAVPRLFFLLNRHIPGVYLFLYVKIEISISPVNISRSPVFPGPAQTKDPTSRILERLLQSSSKR